MKFSFTELANTARKIPFRIQDFTPAGAGPVPTAETLSPAAKEMLEVWKPIIEKAEVEKHIIGGDQRAKHFRAATELVIAQMLTNFARSSRQELVREATLVSAGDVPSYAKQQIAMILRAFPKMFTLQLFPTTPFSGPDGRIYFRTGKYNSARAAGTDQPEVADGDSLHDLTKFGSLYAKAAELAAAKRTKLSITSMTASVESYRVTSQWSYESEDDFGALYGGDLGSSLMAQNAWLLQQTTDRVMLNAAFTAANTAETFDATPAGYDALSYSEQKVYDERIFTHGILPVITGMQQARAYSTTPDWVVCGPAAAERIQKLSTFVPFANAQGDQLTFQQGAIRDVGTLRAVNMRVIVDPLITTNGGEIMLFGHKPMSDFDPAIHYCPYKALRPTGKLELPNTGEYEQGVYSRFAVVTKNTGSNADSSQLGDAYGTLTITA